MKKKYLLELINYLEEYVYHNNEMAEGFLTLAHFYYLSKDNDNFLKNLDIFLKKSKDKNLYELEKLAFFDESFDIVLREELYYFLENSYSACSWDNRFIEKSLDFIESVSKDVFLKPYFLCELLKNSFEKSDYIIAGNLLKNILSNYSNSKWEILAMTFYADIMKKTGTQKLDDIKDKDEFLNDFREHVLYFAQKYPQEEKACEYLFCLGEILKTNNEYEKAVKLYSRISDIYNDEIIKVKVLFELGKIYHKQGNSDKTIEIYTELFNNFETKKEIIEIKFESAGFLAKQGFYKNAFLIFREIAEKFKNTRWAESSSNKILEIGKKLFDNNRYEDSEYMFEQVIKLKNNRDDVSWALYYVGRINEFYAKNSFSCDKREKSKLKAFDIFSRIAQNYNDNKEILGKIDPVFFEEIPRTEKLKSFDFNYIILIVSILLLAVIVFLKIS
ncbi:MAG: tetratricopeptide repeat protein [Candidatus Muirbacterium halophilum]|nr:tetratricopeptide repeat protein [Candidatus Muirbacterium halophilum]MCK9475318.1 tetratricopeptide repeat protein [Candidatus Muirbacterium halophilum]